MIRAAVVEAGDGRRVFSVTSICTTRASWTVNVMEPKRSPSSTSRTLSMLAMMSGRWLSARLWRSSMVLCSVMFIPLAAF